jgi:parvulin-like peptidyl-prolyl isomerase
VNALNPTAGPEGAVARITYRDGSVDYISQETLDLYQSEAFNGPGGAPPAELVLNELITRQLLLRQARNTDVVADAQQVEEFVNNVRTQTCPQILSEQAPTGQADPQAFFDRCADRIGFKTGINLRNFLAEQITINDVATQEAPKDMIRAAHILFKAEDYATAQTAYEQLCGTQGIVTQPEDDRCEGSGANFADLVGQYSIEPGAGERGGELPPFNDQGITEPDPQTGQPNSFDTTFVSNTVALRPAFERGEPAISKPFETQFGWHIVKVLELVASQQSAQAYRDGVLQRARSSQLSDLSQPDSGAIPLIGVAEVLVDLPTPVPQPTLEPIVPEEPPTSPAPEATSILEEPIATPEAETATTTP